MPNWLQTMQQTFEYFIVDPATWKDARQIHTVTSSTISRDLEVETLGSLSININEQIGECYIRIYLATIQNGIRERHPLGTYLVQTPSYSFDGKIQTMSLDAYTPLLELKENPPPLGYSLLEGDNIMEKAYNIVRENLRAPVTKVNNDEKLYFDFVANVQDTWITFVYDLISNAKFTLGLDELGQVIFLPKQETAALQPVWSFDDSNSSILHPKIDIKHDLYGVPNVVEVIYSNGKKSYYSRAVNDDPDSPISTVNRGREIIHRETNPNTIGNPTARQIREYAKKLLKNLSTLEYRVTYTHGYCPVRIGDCVRLNYERAGIKNVKAKVVSQTIKCEPGCPVTETAIFTNRLWR